MFLKQENLVCFYLLPYQHSVKKKSSRTHHLTEKEIQQHHISEATI